tara:strand:+ start:606 stop:1190 length:585 start_codon:yes stop_codon:yes gene_type:complete
MRKNLLFLIFGFGLLSGAQKNEGLILQKKTYTALIQFGQNIVIYGVDEKQSIRGQLVNVTQETIHLKDIYTEKIKTISITNVKEIKTIESSAKSKKHKNFKTGFGEGAKIASFGALGLIAVVSIDNPDKHLAPFFFAIIAPPAAMAGGIIGGVINMSSAKYEIEDVDSYRINENNWRVMVPESSEQGFRKFLNI